MKKFLIKVCIFTSTFLILNQTPRLFLRPYFGNECYAKKYEYLANNKQHFNSFIFGSSRAYRHVDADMLDELLKDYKISTFNLASIATFCPESYYLYEEFLKNTKPNTIKLALLEVTPLCSPDDNQLNTSRNYYWHNYKYSIFAMDYIYCSNYSTQKKADLLRKYTKSYLYNIINTSSLEAFRDSNVDWMGRQENGFYALDHHAQDFGGNNWWRQRCERFQKNPKVLYEALPSIKRDFSPETKKIANEAHVKKLMELSEKSAEKGIHLIFFISPGQSSYSEVAAIKEQLPVIEIVNPDKYPELYKIPLWFDVGHLNSKGAKLFTTYLAEEIRKCLKERENQVK